MFGCHKHCYNSKAIERKTEAISCNIYQTAYEILNVALLSFRFQQGSKQIIGFISCYINTSGWLLPKEFALYFAVSELMLPRKKVHFSIIAMTSAVTNLIWNVTEIPFYQRACAIFTMI